MKVRKSNFLLAALFIVGFAHAQDPFFTQMFANRLYLNPALTGIENNPNFHAQYRNQWPSLSSNFQTTNLSYDQQLKKIKSGIGAIMMYDNQGNVISTSTLGLNYAYHPNIGKSLKLHIGTQVLYGYKSIDWSKLSYGDMIDPSSGFIYQTGDLQRNNYKGYLDVSFGLAGEWKGLFFGATTHHVNQPNVSLLMTKSKLPMRHTAQIGYNFKINFGDDENKKVLTITPSVFYQVQQSFDMLVYGGYLNFMNFTMGAFKRSHNSVSMLAGYDFNAIRLAYSYDYFRLSTTTIGSHEISLSYRLGANFKNRIEKQHQFPTF